MSSQTETPTPAAVKPLRTDTLADSVLILLALSAVQRVVGFCRAVLFCRWLDADQLGQWDMAFSFLLVAAPLSVLSLSGSFRRYVEYYRQRFQLRTLLRRTATFYAVCGTLSAAVIWLGRDGFSRLAFGTASHGRLVALMAVGLLAVLAYHFFIDLLTSLRNVRLICVLQLLQSLVFAGLGIALLLVWQRTAASVVTAYTVACLVVSALAVGWLVRWWPALPQQGRPTPHRELWAKLLPFAGWIWLASLTGGLFEVADRYMIVHFSALEPERALCLVGQYHSSRVVPVLLVSVAAMLGSIITPHLSHDWEAGRRQRVSARLNLYLKLTAFCLSAAAVAVMFAAPVLFGLAFQGKFSGGLAVLPWTLTYCVWFGIATVAMNYLWCAEKARLASLALAAGLVTNVALNLLLLPRLGLLGAVLATTAANLVALVLIAAFNHRLGFRMDRGSWVALALPPLVCLGPWVALAVLAALAVDAVCHDRLLTADEKQQIAESWLHYRKRFRGLRLACRSVS